MIDENTPFEVKDLDLHSMYPSAFAHTPNPEIRIGSTIYIINLITQEFIISLTLASSTIRIPLDDKKDILKSVVNRHKDEVIKFLFEYGT